MRIVAHLQNEIGLQPSSSVARNAGDQFGVGKVEMKSDRV